MKPIDNNHFLPNSLGLSPFFLDVWMDLILTDISFEVPLEVEKEILRTTKL